MATVSLSFMFTAGSACGSLSANRKARLWNSLSNSAKFVDSRGAISRRVQFLSELMFTISESIRCTPTEDGCIVLDTRHGQILSLNVVGSRIFGLVQRGFNQAQIADEISRDFEMSLQIVRADVVDFLANLQKHKILQPCRSEGVL
jgi:hypothetical protein